MHEVLYSHYSSVEVYQKFILTQKYMYLFSPNQEKVKPVPTLASSEYGHRLENEYDKPDRLHVRIGYVQSEFYRRNGIPWVKENLCGNLWHFARWFDLNCSLHKIRSVWRTTRLFYGTPSRVYQSQNQNVEYTACTGAVEFLSNTTLVTVKQPAWFCMEWLCSFFTNQCCLVGIKHSSPVL